jgi:hypothetical protein
MTVYDLQKAVLAAKQNYTAVKNLQNAELWVLSAATYYKEAKDKEKPRLLYSQAKDAQQIQLMKQRKLVPTVQTRSSTFVASPEDQIRSLYNYLDAYLTKLSIEIHRRQTSEFETYFLPEFENVDRQLLKFKDMVNAGGVYKDAYQTPIRNFQMRLGDLKSKYSSITKKSLPIYKRKDGESQPTGTTTIGSQQDNTPSPNTTSTSIVWLIALMLLL